MSTPPRGSHDAQQSRQPSREDGRLRFGQGSVLASPSDQAPRARPGTSADRDLTHQSGSREPGAVGSRCGGLPDGGGGNDSGSLVGCQPPRARQDYAEAGGLGKDARQLPRARRYLEHAIGILEHAFGENHRQTGSALDDYGIVLRDSAEQAGKPTGGRCGVRGSDRSAPAGSRPGPSERRCSPTTSPLWIVRAGTTIGPLTASRSPTRPARWPGNPITSS